MYNKIQALIGLSEKNMLNTLCVWLACGLNSSSIFVFPEMAPTCGKLAHFLKHVLCNSVDMAWFFALIANNRFYFINGPYQIVCAHWLLVVSYVVTKSSGMPDFWQY